MMGRYSYFSGSKIPSLLFNEAVMDILTSYGDLVYEATEEGLAAAEKVLIRRLKLATPKRTGNFRKNWKGTGKRYTLVRFVGNTTTVTNKSGEEIALANIFEYSTTRGKPFIRETYINSIDEMAQAVVDEIKKI